MQQRRNPVFSYPVVVFSFFAAVVLTIMDIMPYGQMDNT
jgi:hypothetical protein